MLFLQILSHRQTESVKVNVKVNVKVKVKQTRYRPGVAQKVPGS